MILITTGMRLNRGRQHCHAVLLAAVGLVLMPSPAPAGPLQFRSENIDITIHGDRSTITGDYHLVTEGDSGGGMLYYPFAVGPSLPYPDSVSIIDLATEGPIPYVRSVEGIRFPVRIAGSDSFDFRVTYVQRTPGGIARYILTTTQRWGQPLRRADFSIHIPASIQLTRISVSPDSLEYSGSWRTYRIRRTEFMPTRDLDIAWKEVE